MINYSALFQRLRHAWLSGIIASLLLAAILVPAGYAYAEQDELTSSQPVYVIPVKHTIETGLQKFLERALLEAEEAQAKVIILELDTFGGRVDSAEEIGELIRSSKIPTIAFIHGKAVSAGSYIALNANRIVMDPGSSIGAAAVVSVAGERVTDSKIVAHWASVMRSAAELRDRNPQIAEGMVDENIVVAMPEIEKTKKKGEIISLSAKEALKVGYAEHIANDLKEVLNYAEANGHPVVAVELSPAEQLARWLTNPVVMTILLLIGLAGVAIEIFVPGFGFPGILGISAFSLYFFGHYAAGFAGTEHVFMFVAGIVLMVIELFVPGFGIFGIAGMIALMSGVVLAAYDTQSAMLSLGIAFLAAIVVVGVVIKLFKHKGIWNRFILKDELKSELGYVSSSSKEHLLHQAGVALTSLRPSGTATIGDERIDVVTSGEFIPSGRKVKVIQIEGTRVVVRELVE
jgi:membrane-bound serine protease (ClpP class)